MNGPEDASYFSSYKWGINGQAINVIKFLVVTSDQTIER